jgi:CubicO group peptidase (beta-lactamase class C family)
MLAPYARLALLRASPQPASGPLLGPLARRPAPPLSLNDKLARLIQKLYRKDALTGIQIAVYRGGHLAAEAHGGVLGEADPRPVQADTLFNCFSVTKGVAAMALHLLADENAVSYEEPVATYWPEFAAEGKGTITVRHVLSHQAGLHREPSLDIKLHEICNWDGMLQRLANAATSTPPGRLTRYHVLSFGWLMGGIVRGATNGQHLRDLVRERLAGPLNIEKECMLGLGGQPQGAKTPGVAERLATLCNGLFTSSDGSLPDQSEVHKLLETLRQQDSDRREEEMRVAEAETGAPSAAAVATAAASAAPGTASGMRDDAEGGSAGRGIEANQEDSHAGSEVVGHTEEAPHDDEIVYPPKLQRREHSFSEMAMKAIEEVKLAATSGAEFGWQETSTSKGVRLFKREVPGRPLLMVRGTGRIDRHPACVFEMLSNLDNKKKWNQQFRCLEIVEELDDYVRIMRDEYNPIWPVSGRDFCIFQTIHFNDDGGFVVASQSVEDDRAPEQDGIVRAELDIGGAHVCPAPDNPMHSIVTYLVSIDLKGSIPTMVKNAVATKQPLCVDGIRKLCETNTDFERYEKMQRYLARQAMLRAKASGPAGKAPVPPPPTTAAAPTAAERREVMDSLRSPLPSENGALSAASAVAIENNSSASEGAETGTEEGNNAPRELDSNKLLLLDPCIYNLDSVGWWPRLSLVLCVCDSCCLGRSRCSSNTSALNRLSRFLCPSLHR